MNLEIEAKLKVESLETIAGKLQQLGAEFIAEQLQTDSYLDDAENTLKNGDCALRLRLQIDSAGEKIILSYKGPRQKTKLKTRSEFETVVSDLETVTEILSALGYEKKLVLQKKRLLWLLENCYVALDQLPLIGQFVEIEGPDENTISSVQKKLGLESLQHIRQSYTDLIEKQLKQSGNTQREILL